MKQIRPRNLLVAIAALFLCTQAYADDPQLSCSGVSEKWFISIDPLLEAFEYNINSELDKYVSVADFNVGDDNFGAAGTGDLGHINVPKFDNKTPKQYLKSAVQDMGLSPSYTINAKILGGMFEVVKVLATGGQGCGTKNNPSACHAGTATDGQSDKDRLTIDVKVGGISVLSDENDPTETEVPSLTQLTNSLSPTSSLPTSEKKGTGGELADIRRGFNGDKPIARIPVYGVFFITVDAGYSLNMGLIFTYDVQSPGLFTIGGKTTYAKKLDSYTPKPTPASGVANPALDPKDYQVCAFGTSSCTTESSTPGWTKSEQFWNSLNGSAQNFSNTYSGLQNAVRNVRVKETFKDAKMTKIMFKEKLDQLKSDTSLTDDQKVQLMQEMDLGPIKKDIQSVKNLVDNMNYSYDTITSVYNMVEQAVQSISDGEYPEVTASAGVMFEGTAKVWVNANVEMNLYSLVEAWVGMQGEMTLVDAIMGIGASVSSRSQYLDITGKLNYEVLHGEIQIDWGYNTLGGIVSDSGTIQLAKFDGRQRSNDSLIARLDFDPSDGQDMFFWCADLFDNNANLDTERCNDSNIALRKILPAVAAHDDYQKLVLGEIPAGKQSACIIENEGKFIYSSDENSSTCNNLVPSPNATLNNSVASSGEIIPHPIVTAYSNNPQLFLTYLRDDSNHPVMKMVASTSGGGRKVETYTSPQAVFIENSSGQIIPHTFLPTATGMTTASIEDRIFTLTSNGILHDEIVDPNAPTPKYTPVIASADIATAMNEITSSKYQVNLEGISDGSAPYASGSRIYVGHLAGLPNKSIVDLAEKYRLGMCTISGDAVTTPRRIKVGKRIYPTEGEPNGDTFKNAQNPNLGCNLETNVPSQNEVREWEACQLRSLVTRGLCYPSNRITELVEIGNLSDDQKFSYFSGPNKRITGELDFGATVTQMNGNQMGLEIQMDQPPSNLPNTTQPIDLVIDTSSLNQSVGFAPSPYLYNLQYTPNANQKGLVWETNTNSPNSLADKMSSCGGFSKKQVWNSNQWNWEPVPFMTSGTTQLGLPMYYGDFASLDDPNHVSLNTFQYYFNNFAFGNMAVNGMTIPQVVQDALQNNQFQSSSNNPSFGYQFQNPAPSNRPLQVTTNTFTGFDQNGLATYSTQTINFLDQNNCVSDQSIINDMQNGNNALAYATMLDHSNMPTSNSPHTVGIACVAGSSQKWRAYLHSIKITRPYAINGNPIDECEYPNVTGTACPNPIVETYDQVPPLNNFNKINMTSTLSICNASDMRNINNYPYGPGYGQSKLQQMKSGSLHRTEMLKAITACMNNGDCKYVPEAQNKTNPPVCTVQASSNTTLYTETSSIPGKNLNACLGSRIEYSDAGNFCRKHQADILSAINNPNVNSVTVDVSGQWQQEVDIGNIFHRTESDPASGRRTIGKCLFEKQNGNFKFVSAANKRNDDPEPSDCLLNAASPVDPALDVNLSKTTVSNYKGAITADLCKSRFGYQSGSKAAASETIQNASLCSSLTGAQFVQLQKNGILPASGIGSFTLKAKVSNPNNPNNGQTVNVGTCSYAADDHVLDKINTQNHVLDKINTQTRCTLQMQTQTGYSVAPIEIYMPPPQTGVSRSQQCADQIWRYVISSGQPPICSAELRKRPEYAALSQSGGSFSFYTALGNTPVSEQRSCQGPALHEDQAIPTNEYNADCQVHLRGLVPSSPDKIIYLDPIEKMNAIDPNKAFSIDHGNTTALNMCTNYWNYTVNRYLSNGDLSNSKYCQSIHEDVKAQLPTLQPSVPAPNGSNTWSTNPMAGTVTTVNVFANVFAPMQPCTNCGINRTAAPTNSSSAKKKTLQVGDFIPPQERVDKQIMYVTAADLRSPASTGIDDNNGSGPLNSPIGPNDGGGTGGSTDPIWQTSEIISQCNYEFKQLSNGEWDLMDKDWIDYGAPVSAYDPNNVRVHQCIKDLNGACTDTNAGDLMIFAGSGNRAMKTYAASQIPSPVDQNLVDQFCDENYDRIVPLADTLVSDPNKRFPVWLRFVNPDGSVDVPTATSNTQYYCKPKSCELWVEFGNNYSQPTESEWKDKLSAMPTTAAACNTYYKNQVSAYCSKLLLLSQMPDNMDVTLKYKFDNQSAVVGVCSAPETRRTCNIGQRKPESWLSWIAGSGFSKVESVENFNKSLILPSRFTKKDLIIPNFFANTLAACVETANEMNSGNQLCARDASGIDHSGPYEIAVQFGEFTQTIASCSGYVPGSVSKSRVSEKPIAALLTSNDNCSYSIDINNYVENATIQVAACVHRDCNPDELKVIYADKPESKTEKLSLDFSDILKATWSESARGSGSIYINQADRLGNLGEWVQISPDAYAKYGSELVSNCGVSVADMSAKIVGDVCEKTYLQLSGFEKGSVMEAGICTRADRQCTQKDYQSVYKQADIQENQMALLPIIEATWPKVGPEGTVAVRQHYADGRVGEWISIDQNTYISSVKSAISECGVRP